MAYKLDRLTFENSSQRMDNHVCPTDKPGKQANSQGNEIDNSDWIPISSIHVNADPFQ